jgi:hypothetical protein
MEKENLDCSAFLLSPIGERIEVRGFEGLKVKASILRAMARLEQ